MLTLGVDLASQPKRTATCLICWDRKPAVVTSFSVCATDCDLLDLFGRADKIGIDAPFGWPARFVRAIHGNSTSTDWPTVDICQLRFRTTDQVVRKKLKRWPLSVAIQTMLSTRSWRLLSLELLRTNSLQTSRSSRRGGLDRATTARKSQKTRVMSRRHSPSGAFTQRRNLQGSQRTGMS